MTVEVEFKNSWVNPNGQNRFTVKPGELKSFSRADASLSVRCAEEDNGGFVIFRDTSRRVTMPLVDFKGSPTNEITHRSPMIDFVLGRDASSQLIIDKRVVAKIRHVSTPRSEPGSQHEWNPLDSSL